MLIVQKYGGTSVADTEKIFSAADKIASDYLRGNDMVIVLSAQGNTTDKLLEKAGEISRAPKKRELDALLATGEQQSAALMAMALTERGLKAISLNAMQAGIFSTSEHGCAKIVSVDPDRIKAELKRRNIVVITGFQGCTELGETTTLGRGASDTTAIALAAALSADLCEIYTDVAGIFTADPRMVKDAIRHRDICYDNIMELSAMGASVLHSRSVELANKFGVEFSVKSSGEDTAATIIKGGTSIEKRLVSGITSEKGVSKVSVAKLRREDVPAVLKKLAEAHITVDIITHESGDEFDSISFTIATDKTEVMLTALSDYFEATISVRANLAKLSVTGTGIAYDTGVSTVFYETLMKEDIRVHMLSLSMIKISALVAESDITTAILALHERFKEEGKFSITDKKGV